ncbi:hypothetical protein Dsin_031098 [Dipteronia sinensis]|uniref:FAS1 domain-containing protein n=1 Tax=Dipteronia sinensis TaxID=43782 RepID=A0AAE0DS15_9ROSI|nr:hypothetical protein Dsin_031098 [Dipteronia sinensis]
MATTLLLFSLIIFSLSGSALASDSNALFNALESLSYSGYLSMALTLQITCKSLNLESETMTLFAPSDFAFAKSGQLSLLDLQLHISPAILSQGSLKNLSFGTRIPTLLSNQSLIVTTSNGQLSINGVLIQESAVFDQGSVVIYGIDDFLNSSFHIGTTSHSAPEPSPSSAYTMENNVSHLLELSGFDVDVFGNASNWLRSRGYTVMATFLDVQLAGFNKDEARLTIFAPVDEAVEAYAKNMTDYVSMFQRHVVPGLLAWKDLAELQDGTLLPTFSGGFEIKVTWSGDILLLNGVPVVFPDMYSSDWLVLHGINSLLVSPMKQEIIGQSLSELNGEDYQNQFDYEYGMP